MIDPRAHRAAVFVIPTTRAARHERTQDGQADNSADCDEEPEEQRSLRGGGPLVIPPRRGLKPKSAPALLSLAQEAAFEKLAVRLGARIEPQQKSRDHVRVAPRVNP